MYADLAAAECFFSAVRVSDLKSAFVIESEHMGLLRFRTGFEDIHVHTDDKASSAVFSSISRRRIGY